MSGIGPSPINRTQSQVLPPRVAVLRAIVGAVVEAMEVAILVHTDLQTEARREALELVADSLFRNGRFTAGRESARDVLGGLPLTCIPFRLLVVANVRADQTVDWMTSFQGAERPEQGTAREAIEVAKGQLAAAILSELGHT